MALTLKIIGGTLGSTHLCERCQNAQFMTDAAGQDSVFCGRIGRLIKTKIVKCNSFVPAGAAMADYKIRSLAWEIDVHDKKVVFEDPKHNFTIFEDGKLVERKKRARRRRVYVRSRSAANPTVQ
jgi:hypothetical protein